MFDPIIYLKVFAIGGAVCLLAQILIITTRMTSARILVTFLLLGVLLQTVGVFDAMTEFAASGVTVPIMGFGAILAKGAIEGGAIDGVLGIISGGLEASAAVVASTVIAAFIFALIFNSRTKK